MNLIAPILPPERIRLDLDAHTRKRVFEEAGRVFADIPGLDPVAVGYRLVQREALGSTALGLGVALPHARIGGIAQPLAAYLRLQLPIPFDAADGKPVSDLLVLLVPEIATEDHLRLLAEVAQMFTDRHFREHLRRQSDVTSAWRAFADWQAGQER